MQPPSNQIGSPKEQPRDHSATATVGLVRATRVFSNVVSPPVIFAVLALALSWYELDFWPGLFWAAIYGFWVSLAPILLVVYMLRTGRISDLHMSSTRERRLPYIAGVAGSVIALLLIQVFDGPDLLACLTLFSLVELSLLGLITVFWLISIHSASIAAATMIAGLVFGPWMSVLLLPLVGLVCLARLYLRRHTLAQVLAGLVLGVTIVTVITLLGCFN